MGSPSTNAFSPPFAGGQKLVHSVSWLTPCGSNTSTNATGLARADLKSGIMHLDSDASFNGSCAGTTIAGGSVAQSLAGFRTAPFNVTATRNYNVTFHLILNWNASAFAKGTYAYSDVIGYILLSVVESPNNTSVGHLHKSVAFVSMSAHSSRGQKLISIGRNVNETIVISLNLSVGHLYRAESTIHVSTGAGVSSGTAGVAISSIELARGRMTSVLSSVVIS